MTSHFIYLQQLFSLQTQTDTQNHTHTHFTFVQTRHLLIALKYSVFSVRVCVCVCVSFVGECVMKVLCFFPVSLTCVCICGGQAWQLSSLSARLH